MIYYYQYSQLERDLIIQIEKELSLCFSQKVILDDPDTTIVLNTEELEDSHAVLSIATFKINENILLISNVCATSRAKVSKTKPTMVLLQDIISKYKDMYKIRLYVDLYNPYWDRAVGLYTKLNFGTILSEIGQPQNYIQMELWPDQLDKEYQIGELDKYRKQFFKDYEYQRVSFDSSIAEFGKYIVTKKREYGGYFYFDGDVITEMSNFVSGNIIDEKFDAPATCSRFYNGALSFHTHPIIATKNNILLFNPPSGADLSNLFECKDIIKEYVFDAQGIFSVGLTHQIHAHFCKNPDLKESWKKIALDLYLEIVNTLVANNDVLLLHQYPDIYTDHQIQELISYVLSIKVNDIPIFDMRYWSYESIIQNGMNDILIYPKNCIPLQFLKNKFFIPFRLSQDIKDLLEAFEKLEQNIPLECIGVPTINPNTLLPGLYNYCYPYSFIDIGEIISKISKKWSQKDRVIQMILDRETIGDIYDFIGREMKVD